VLSVEGFSKLNYILTVHVLPTFLLTDNLILNFTVGTSSVALYLAMFYFFDKFNNCPLYFSEQLKPLLDHCVRRERDSDRQTERETERQTDRQTDRGNFCRVYWHVVSFYSKI